MSTKRKIKLRINKITFTSIETIRDHSRISLGNNYTKIKQNEQQSKKNRFKKYINFKEMKSIR